VNCPAKITKFHLKGELDFIENERIVGISSIISVPNSTVNYDLVEINWSGIYGWLIANWYFYGIAALIIVIGSIALVVCGPSLAQFAFVLCRICQSVRLCKRRVRAVAPQHQRLSKPHQY